MEHIKETLGLSIAVFVSSLACAQSSNHNYINTLTVTKGYDLSNTDDDTDYNDNRNLQKVMDFTYFDGLGRPEQNLGNHTAPDGKYTYTLQEYDNMGRTSKTSLPVTLTGAPDYVGVDDLYSKANSSYNDSHCYTVTSYDAFGNVGSMSVPGNAYQGRKQHMEYSVNGNNEVKHYIAPLDKVSLQKDGYYASGSLTKVTTYDADSVCLIVYTDMRGLKVLERRGREHDNDTYFVYNDLGQLRYVLTPEYQNHGFKAIFGYEYRYDNRGRMVKKILPGCGYTQYWYDSADHLTYMQDAQLREKGKYRFMLYDFMGRLAVQGLCSDRGIMNNQDATLRYSKGGGGILSTDYILPTGMSILNPELEIVNYYDSYDFADGSSAGRFSEFTPDEGISVKSFKTATIVAASNGELTSTVYGYDYRGNVTESVTKTIGNATVDVATRYSFTNQIDTVSTRFKIPTYSTINASTMNTYNVYNNKLETMNISVSTSNHSASKLLSFEYDSLGRVSMLNRHGDAGYAIYNYDLHGWLRSISTPTFSERLYYGTSDGYNKPCYNGNISAQRWTNGNNQTPRWYNYSYDRLNRLRSATYSELDDHSLTSRRYDEEVLKYDGNGNIERLQRCGRKQDGKYGKIDNLHIHYNGNQLDSVKDDAAKLYYAGAFDFNGDGDNIAHYEYNDMGSLIEDTGRGIAMIEYDDFNNPRRIQFANGNVTKYVYTATGEKLRTIHYTAAPDISVPYGQTHELVAGEILYADSTDYVGNLILSNGCPTKYLFDGGYYVLPRMSIAQRFAPASFGNTIDIGGAPEGGSFHFFNYDHLGNVREVVGDDGTLEQVNNYYPFGAPFTDNATSAKNPDLQPYKYTGKELDLTHGLNTYDHGARQNYSILGVWDRVDPMCEKYYNVSPYSFCLNNPMVLKDDNGQFPKKVMALFSWILYRITQDGNPGPIIENSNAKDENLRYMYTSSYFHDGEIEVVGHINYNDDVQTALDNGELIGEYGGKAGTVITLTAPIITALGSVFGLPEIGLTVGEIGEGVSLSANAVKDISMLLNGKGITCFFEDVIFSTFGKMGGKLIRRAVPDRDLGEVVLEQIYDAKVATFQEVYDMINKRDDDER